MGSQDYPISPQLSQREAAGLTTASRGYGRLAGEVRHDVLPEALGLLEVRVAREDKRIDAFVSVLLQAPGDVFARADEGRSYAEPRLADAGPEVRPQPEIFLGCD